jgi:hypothetical protein
VGAQADSVEDWPHLERRRHFFDENAIGFAMKWPQRVQHQLLDS